MWLERGADPAGALERSLVHWIARAALAFVWLYHGIVPKLLGPSGEIDLAVRTGVAPSLAPMLILATAVFEMALGLGILVLREVRPAIALSSLLAIGLAIVTSTRIPELVVAPFQPVTLGVAMVALGAVAVLVDRDLPSARRCLRGPRRE